MELTADLFTVSIHATEFGEVRSDSSFPILYTNRYDTYAHRIKSMNEFWLKSSPPLENIYNSKYV